MEIAEELSYLYALERFGIKPGLAVMEQMMEALGHPERKFKSIHVTGTNGKGSTCAMMESMLREAGYTTALYTSPHLYAFNERVQINRVPISDEALVLLVKEIREACEKDALQPTFFEFTTVLAYLHFSRSNIDIAVIEVGMGGRYDATNVITPLLSVITNVGLDHTDYLGPTTAHIAREKAGIIKEGVPVVTAESDIQILDIFNQEAQEKHTRVICVQDVTRVDVISSALDGQEIHMSFLSSHVGFDRKTPVHLPLLGSHQVTNMQTAVVGIGTLSSQGFPVSQEAMVAGIAHTVWEGRLQILSREPLIIIDGAHNPDGARALALFLKNIPSYDVLVFGAKKGKDISDMLQSVIPLFSHVIVTEGSFMAEAAEVLAEKIRTVHPNVVIEKDVPSAFRIATTHVPKSGTIVGTGSLYMIADALVYLQTV